jgi:ABC-type uncharacterized transport system involved in gliding motility auxiliary subunit
MKKVRFSGRKLKYGSMTIVFTVLFIAAAVVLNILVNVATERFGLRLDLTDNRMYEISDETKLFLQNDLKENIKIEVFLILRDVQIAFAERHRGPFRPAIKNI